jgi:hypothetical protein
MTATQLSKTIKAVNRKFNQVNTRRLLALDRRAPKYRS